MRIIRLRNDYKALMSQIETGLHEHFAKSKDKSGDSAASEPISHGTSSDNARNSRVEGSENRAGAAFARVNSVVAGSPADQAGLKAGDELRLFGDVNWLNHERLARVARTVQASEGVGHILCSMGCSPLLTQSSIRSR